ncbi:MULTISPECIES: LysR family transcriptional regulator [Ferrimonas]|uniref:LysR family transcriptional regulator n=1 Tax=Ferrimonas TaxID=44011 RepID=UPI0003FF2C5B|nr:MULTISPECIES: LysR family transcriptional regulator [Ferrimonas]USD37362.1 LysR family transcriptional regulator [Ferrimonas sp. SCSIO 43195]
MLNLKLVDIRVFLSIFDSGCSKTTASRLGLSPAKVSRSLAGLRQVYSDSLFIRKKSGFVPTAKASALEQDFRQAMSLLDKQYQKDLARHQPLEVKVALPPTLSVGLPQRLADAASQLPGQVTVSIQPLNLRICQQVLNGSLSMAVTHRECRKLKDCVSQNSDQLQVRRISEGQFLYIVAARDHPVWQRERILEHLAEYPFVITQVIGFNNEVDPFEVWCEQRGHELQVDRKVQSLASLIERLVNSQAISFVGTRCAARFIDSFEGFRAEKLTNDQYDSLHGYQPRPQYSLLTDIGADDRLIPIQDAVERFIREQVN